MTYLNPNDITNDCKYKKHFFEISLFLNKIKKLCPIIKYLLIQSRKRRLKSSQLKKPSIIRDCGEITQLKLFIEIFI